MKMRLAHGRWYPFLAEAGVASRAAQNYLRLYHRREDVRSKSALSADLTIVASLSALRSPKPKRESIQPVNETNATENLAPPMVESELADAAGKGVGAEPPTVSTEVLVHGERLEIPAGGSCPATEGTSAEVVGEATNETPTNGSFTESAVHGRLLDNYAPQAAPASQIAVGAATAPDADGFISVDGTRWLSDHWDDGLVPIKWIQGQIKRLGDNNHTAPSKYKREIDALRLTEIFLVELARTANRVCNTSDMTPEDAMLALNEVMCQLWNFTQMSPALVRQRERLAATAFFQDNSAHNNPA